MKKTVLFLCMTAFSLPAFAIFKCETNGKISYSDIPCPQGKVTNFTPAAGPTAKDVNAAVKLTEKQKDILSDIEKNRRKEEAAEEKRSRQAARESVKQRKRCTSLALQKKWREEDVAAASGKAVEKARVKARRASEKFDSECKSFQGLI